MLLNYDKYPGEVVVQTTMTKTYPKIGVSRLSALKHGPEST